MHKENVNYAKNNSIANRFQFIFAIDNPRIHSRRFNSTSLSEIYTQFKNLFLLFKFESIC